MLRRQDDLTEALSIVSVALFFHVSGYLRSSRGNGNLETFHAIPPMSQEDRQEEVIVDPPSAIHLGVSEQTQINDHSNWRPEAGARNFWKLPISVSPSNRIFKHPESKKSPSVTTR